VCDPCAAHAHSSAALYEAEDTGQSDKKVMHHLTTELTHQLMRDAEDRSANVDSDGILTLQEGTNMAAATGKNLNWSNMSFSLRGRAAADGERLPRRVLQRVGVDRGHVLSAAWLPRPPVLRKFAGYHTLLPARRLPSR
jgi:hypothetical protein